MGALHRERVSGTHVLSGRPLGRGGSGRSSRGGIALGAGDDVRGSQCGQSAVVAGILDRSLPVSGGPPILGYAIGPWQ